MCRSHASEWLITTQGPLPCTVQFSSMPLLLTFIVPLSSCCRALAPVPVRQKVEILPCKDDPFFRPARPPARRPGGAGSFQSGGRSGEGGAGGARGHDDERLPATPKTKTPFFFWCFFFKKKPPSPPAPSAS